VSYASEREWYTLEIKAKSGGILGFGAQEQSFFMTFVVFPAAEYTIGSAADEANHRVNEARHPVKLTRPIAVSDREIAWEQFNSFDNRLHHDTWEKQYVRQLTATEPVFGVNWYEAVSYCRWLTKYAGMSEDDQAYGDPASLDQERFPADPDPQALSAPRNWPVNLEKRGFRLPTDAEWEVACRSGTNTAYSFGNDLELLGSYGWFAENSNKWSHAVGLLRPGPRGLFDVHGNLFEWCHDWFDDFPNNLPSEDPTGLAVGSARVARSGSWDDVAMFFRSAHREGIQPTIRARGIGIRVVQVPLEKETRTKSQEPGASSRGGR
jgi:formylglycine-generating enzyme required for sulfatase activity